MKRHSDSTLLTKQTILLFHEIYMPNSFLKALTFILCLAAGLPLYAETTETADTTDTDDTIESVATTGTVEIVATAEKPVVFDGFSIADSLEYSAEIIDYLYEDKKIILTGNAQINYMGNTLSSGRIVFHQDYNFLEAEGVPDSSGVLQNTPVFTDTGGQEMRGLSIKYDLASQKGFIRRGRTDYETGFMAADRIKRASEDTLYIANGTYTTCDLEEDAHFYFAGKQMKFILDDKLIIKPIVGYINKIPVFWFPFYVFPIKKGRQSGFLTPRYGSSRREGRYFSNLGYYYAPNEYMDYKGAGTLRERNGWLVNNWMNYNKQYVMSGSIFGSYESRRVGGEKSRQYKFRLSHRHTVSPTMTISGSGRFESSSYSSYNSRNLREMMNQELNSSVTMRKRWKQSGNSLITTLKHSKRLDSGRTTTTLPSISFSKPRKLLFGEKNEKSNRKYQINAPVEATKDWKSSIYYSFNTKFNNNASQDTLGTGYNRAMDLNTSLSSSHKLMGWLVTEPSVSLRESMRVKKEIASSENYSRNDNISAGMKLNTTIYGNFAPNIGNVTAIRHVMTPSVSYSYGKRREYEGDDPDVWYRFDKDDNDRGRTNNINLSLRNLFQSKSVDGDKEKKTDLFKLDFSTSMNMEAEERIMSPVRTSFDFRPFKVFTTRLTATHSFYDEDDNFDISNPYLDNLSITSNLGLSQRSLGFLSVSSRDDANSSFGTDEFDSMENDRGNSSSASSSSGSKAFNLRFSHTYGIRRRARTGSKDEYNITHTIKPELSFSPTRNFSVRYFCYFNFKDKELVDQRIVISRDLHCWEANLSWVPEGYREGFYFKVNIKDLPDVKIEQRRGSSRIGY